MFWDGFTFGAGLTAWIVLMVGSWYIIYRAKDNEQ